MNCLSQRKKFKNKHPAWDDPTETKLAEPIELEPEDDDDKEQGSESSSEEDEVDEIAVGEVRSKRVSLESKELRYKHLTNLNNERSNNGGVRRVQFNPKSKVALVTLDKGQVDLYSVDGERNTYIQNIKLPYSHRPHSSFTPDGNSIVIAAENYKGSYIVYDMITTNIFKYRLKVGYDLKNMSDFKIHNDYMACRLNDCPDIYVIDSNTHENRFTLKINEPARAVEFTKNNEIFIAGDNAKIYIWDLRNTSRCKHKFQDEGSVHTTSFALSESSNSLSIGSDCGIVNSYELDACLTNRFPTPTRTYTNLKTPIDILNYNHNGELLLMGSSKLNEAFRMIHSHSGTVYRNFPVPQKKYGRLLGADFSPLSGYLALGCSNGRAYLCRIPYFRSY